MKESFHIDDLTILGLKDSSTELSQTAPIEGFRETDTASTGNKSQHGETKLCEERFKTGFEIGKLAIEWNQAQKSSRAKILCCPRRIYTRSL